jgi:hypothetical protein
MKGIAGIELRRAIPGLAAEMENGAGAARWKVALLKA